MEGASQVSGLPPPIQSPPLCGAPTPSQTFPLFPPQNTQVPNSLRLHLRLRDKRGLHQSDSPRGSCARPGCGALQVAGGHGGVGAAGGTAGAARDRPCRLGQVVGLTNNALAAPCATLVPALPPQGGHRNARRPGRRRAVQRRL